MGSSSVITKPNIASDIAVYSLKGVLTKTMLTGFYNNLDQHRVILRSLKVQAVLISLKDVIEIPDEEMPDLYRKLEELNGDIKVPTGFCNYTTQQFKKIKKETNNSSIALVKTPKVAALVMGSARISKTDTILVYDDDTEEKNLMFSEFISKGYSVVAAKDKEDFVRRAHNKDAYGAIVRESRLSGIYKSVFIRISEGFYTYAIRGYIDDSLSAIFNMKAHKYRMEDGFRGFLFDFSRVTAVHVRAGFFLKELSKATTELGGALYIYGINQEKITTNTIELLKNSPSRFFDTYEECIADAKASGFTRKPLAFDEEKGVSLTREAVKNIPIFAKAVLSTLGVFAGAKGQKKMERTRVADLLRKPMYTSGMISFDGDMNGTLFFMTSKSLMERVGKLMLETDTIDDATALDLTSEIMNTIGGKIKIMVSEKNIPISISLPQSSNSKKDLVDLLGNKEGIGIELSIEDDKFYLFLIGSILLDVL